MLSVDMLVCLFTHFETAPNRDMSQNAFFPHFGTKLPSVLLVFTMSSAKKKKMSRSDDITTKQALQWTLQSHRGRG